MRQSPIAKGLSEDNEVIQSCRTWYHCFIFIVRNIGKLRAYYFK